MANVETLYVDMFEEGIRLLQQQMPSKLEFAVSRASNIGEKKSFDQIESTELDERFGRNTDTPISDPDHRRRWINTRDFEKAFLFDKEDRHRVLNDPINAYTRTFQAARNRKVDDLIIEAFDAAAVTGKDGTGSTAFAGGNFAIVDGGANLTPAKIRQARQVLENQDNMEDESMFRWYLAISPNAKDALLGNTEITSGDFSSLKPLMDGKLANWLGFTLIVTTRLPLSGNIRSCFAWVKESMKFGMGGSPTTRAEERADKSYAMQVYRADHFGATRMDEKGVVRINIDESV